MQMKYSPGKRKNRFFSRYTGVFYMFRDFCHRNIEKNVETPYYYEWIITFLGGIRH